MGEVADKENTVLVGNVGGRVYTAEILTSWVKEIWDSTLKELPEVQNLSRG